MSSLETQFSCYCWILSRYDPSSSVTDIMVKSSCISRILPPLPEKLARRQGQDDTAQSPRFLPVACCRDWGSNPLYCNVCFCLQLLGVWDHPRPLGGYIRVVDESTNNLLQEQMSGESLQHHLRLCHALLFPQSPRRSHSLSILSFLFHFLCWEFLHVSILV